MVRLFCNGTVRYVGTLFKLTYEAFYVQRAAVNEDSCDRARRALSLEQGWAIAFLSGKVKRINLVTGP